MTMKETIPWTGNYPASLTSRYFYQYPNGSPVQYGVWNDMTKRFVFGLRDTNRARLVRRMFQVMGVAAYRYRYEIRAIPPGWKNPRNPTYAKEGDRR